MEVIPTIFSNWPSINSRELTRITILRSSLLKTILECHIKQWPFPGCIDLIGSTILLVLRLFLRMILDVRRYYGKLKNTPIVGRRRKRLRTPDEGVGHTTV